MLLFKNSMSAASKNYEVEHDGLAMAMFESFREFSDLKGGIPIALSNVYEMFVTDTARTEDEKTAVLEGVIGDAWTKIKEFFKNIAAKIKSWFKSVVKFFQTLFLSNKKFIAKFEDEIVAKDASKFTYKGHKWSIKGPSAAMCTKVAKVTDYTKVAFDTAQGIVNVGGSVSDSGAHEKISEKKRDIDRLYGARNVSDAREKFRKEITGGEKRDITGFSAVSIKDMIKAITDEKEIDSSFQDTTEAISTSAEKMSDMVEKLMSEYTSHDAKKRANFSTYLNAAVEVGKYGLSYETALANEFKTLAHQMVAEYSSALRSFARYKPAKEDYIPEGASGSQSLLEAYMIDA